MSLMNTIIDYGFKLLDKMMSSSSDSSESNTKSSTDSGLSEEDLKNHLDEYHNQLKNTIRTTVKSAIKDAVLSLENTIKSESNRVIDKIESDQQEKLLSTIKLATFYLEIEDYENAKN